MARNEIRGPKRPEHLLIVVDLANVRPEHRRAELGYGPDDRWLPTSIEYIDQFLAQLRFATPGSVIVKFADYALRRSLSVADQEELFRRASLPWDDPERIYIVRWADPAVLTAAAHYGAAVVSGDKYEDDDLEQYKSPDIRYYRPKYAPETRTFTFGHGIFRRDLASWWTSEFGDLDPAWVGSDHHQEIEFNLRSVVNEATAEFHAPYKNFEVWREEEVTAEVVAALPPKPRKIYERLPEWVAPRPPTPPPGAAVPVFFCDDDREIAPLAGRRVFLVGRAAAHGGRTYLEWFPNDMRFEIKGYGGPVSSGINDFVRIMVEVGSVDGGLELTAVAGREPQSMTMAQVDSARREKQRERVPVSPWTVPQSKSALVNLKRLWTQVRRRERQPDDPIRAPEVEVIRWSERGPQLLRGRFSDRVRARWAEDDEMWFLRWMEHDETRERWNNDRGFQDKWLNDRSFRTEWRARVFPPQPVQVQPAQTCTQCVLVRDRGVDVSTKASRNCSTCYATYGEVSEQRFRAWRLSNRESRDAALRVRRIAVTIAVVWIVFWLVVLVGVPFASAAGHAPCCVARFVVNGGVHVAPGR